ncbi:MAG: inositol monophosphatase [Rickettsiales bacterium]|nr:inositol monophosphatase [Rickettsiales bacterium]
MSSMMGSATTESALMRVIKRSVYKAAKPLIRDFNEVEKLQVSKKGTANFVTDADLRTEKILMEELGHARKDFGFITEETGDVKAAEGENRFWIIDPIDGTSNFIHAIPYFCVSVAAAEKLPDGKFDILAGVIYDPIHDELFEAEKGMGAKVNGQRLQVSERKEDLFLGTATPRATHQNFEQVESTLRRVAASGATVRCAGAAALDLAYVAAAKYDAVWFHRLKPWDMAAGMLLVTEAGGQVGEINGGDDMMRNGGILASNGVVHRHLTDLLVNNVS